MYFNNDGTVRQCCGAIAHEDGIMLHRNGYQRLVPWEDYDLSVIGDKGAKQIGQILVDNATLTELNLSEQNLTHAGMKSLCQGLKRNSHLTSLILDGNDIGSKGATSLASALRENSFLKMLSLCESFIGDDGTAALAHTLNSFHTLVSLRLDTNNISNSGGQLLLDCLNRNRTLTQLSLSDNEIDHWILSGIQNKLAENKNLEDRINSAKKRAFVNAMIGDAKAPWRRSKLMLVGQGRGGKTSTVRSLLGLQFEEQWISTVGISLTLTETKIRESCKSWSQLEASGSPIEYATCLANRVVLSLFPGDGKGSSAESPIADDSYGRQYTKRSRTKRFHPYLTDKNAEIESSGDKHLQLNIGSGDDLLLKDDCRSERSERDVAHRFSLEKLEAEKDETLSFSIWDYGGQQVFYTMHHLFLTSCGIYLLIFDMRDLLTLANELENHDPCCSEPDYDDENPIEYIKFWLNSVGFHASTAPVLLVGTFYDVVENQSDLRRINHLLETQCINYSEHRNKIVRNTASNLNFFPLSNKDGRGVDIIKKQILSETKKQAHVNENISLRWMRSLDNINSRSERLGIEASPYMSFSDIRKEALAVGVASREEVETMLTFFNELGVFVYIPTTESLRNAVIVKPEWLIGAIGKVICDTTLHARYVVEDHLRVDYENLLAYGLASKDLLYHLWKTMDGINQEKADFLIDLMKQTMLLSEWKFCDNKKEKLFLVPCMVRKVHLPKSERIKLSHVALKKLCQCAIGQDLYEYSNNIEPEPEMEMDSVLNAKCVFEFGFLPTGAFERLICLSVAHSSAINCTRPPVVQKESCLVWFGEDTFVHIHRCRCQKATVFKAKSLSMESIVVFINVTRGLEGNRSENPASCSRSYVNLQIGYCFRILMALFQKLKHDVMGKFFEYNIFLENFGDSKLVPYAQAKTAHLKPWFVPSHACNTNNRALENTNRNLDCEKGANVSSDNVNVKPEAIRKVDIAAFLNHLHKHR